jgi:branched-chain amino acid transport system ATP-binding protein
MARKEGRLMGELLEFQGVAKYFGGLAAIAGVTFTIESGELIGLIGPNGAGKTTVFNLLTGLYAPSEGTIRFLGRAINGARPHAVARLGIARTFQNIRLFRSLSVLQNVEVAANLRSKPSFVSAVTLSPAQRRDDAAIEKECLEILDRFGLRSYADERSDSLPYGLQRRLEIARALATKPRLLLLDEPAAGMNPNEKADLMVLIRGLHDDLQLTVLLIEHDTRLVMGICQRVYVLDYGQIIAQGSPEAIARDPKVIEAYLGTDET